ncbi:MAG: HD-GYP domain-containing protein [Lachnospiraceae bacterium]|nr:HD-GYP domain-containing protein [Lachnospiraceae bacterium]
MVKFASKKLEPGMVTAKAIETKRGQVIADEGTILNQQLIARLSFYGIEEVMVTDDSAALSSDNKIEVDLDELLDDLDDITTKDDSSDDIIIEPIPETVTEVTSEPVKHNENLSYTNRVKSSQNFQKFQTDYSKNMVSLKLYFDKIINGEIEDDFEKNLLREPRDLFASKTPLEIFDMVHNMRSVDDSVYAHSLNVALIARAIGKWLKFSKEDLNTLTIAGLLHDIGKTKIPEEILNKQDRLTDEEYQIIKKHALDGYKMLKDKPFDTRIKLAALQHHERFDGSGYPRGLDGDEIDGFASIIAIADVYDAMTAARSYRSAMCAFQVISEFEKDGFQKYNPKVIFTFLKRVAGCYINSRVLISDGRHGIVVFLNTNSLSRPILKLDNGEMLDLSSQENRELHITNIL